MVSMVFNRSRSNIKLKNSAWSVQNIGGSLYNMDQCCHGNGMKNKFSTSVFSERRSVLLKFDVR